MQGAPPHPPPLVLDPVARALDAQEGHSNTEEPELAAPALQQPDAWVLEVDGVQVALVLVALVPSAPVQSSQNLRGLAGWGLVAAVLLLEELVVAPLGFDCAQCHRQASYQLLCRPQACRRCQPPGLGMVRLHDPRSWWQVLAKSWLCELKQTY